MRTQKGLKIIAKVVIGPFKGPTFPIIVLALKLSSMLWLVNV